MNIAAAQSLAAALTDPAQPVFVARPLPRIAPEHDSDVDAAHAHVLEALAPIAPTDAEAATLRAALDATLGTCDLGFRETPVRIRDADLVVSVDEREDLVLVSLSRGKGETYEAFAAFFVEGSDTHAADGPLADPLLLAA